MRPQDESGWVRIAGKPYLYFSGTNYLGISSSTSFRTALIEGLNLYGNHVSVSRAANATPAIFQAADDFMAEWIGLPRALVTSAGFTACQLVLKTLTEKGFRIMHGPGIHPANWRSSVDEMTDEPTQWIKHFIAQRQKKPQEKVALYYKPIDPLKVAETDFSWLAQLPPTTLIVDDSHFIGIQKPNSGRGSYENLQTYAHIDCMIVASLGKAIGIPAGVIAAQAEWIETMAKSPFYIGASMPNAAFLHAMMQIKKEYSTRLIQLQRHIAYLHTQLEQKGLKKHFDSLPTYPIWRSKHHELYTYLLEKDICISHLSYPKLSLPPVTRIVLSAAHDRAQLDTLLSAIKGFFALRQPSAGRTTKPLKVKE